MAAPEANDTAQRVPRGLLGWASRKPRLALLVSVGVGLVLGLVIGAAAASNTSELDKQTKRADRAEQQLANVTGERDSYQTKADDLQRKVDKLSEKVAKLSAQGEVPNFVGQRDVEVREAPGVSDYRWSIKLNQQISSRTPGTVIAQSPREGTVLRAGRSITLTVAKKPPPKPRQWVTISTLAGASSTKTDEFTVPSGVPVRLSYNMPQDGNNAITLYRAPDEYVDLLLNEIGPRSGTTRMYKPGRYFLDVMGAYTIEVQVFKRPE